MRTSLMALAAAASMFAAACAEPAYRPSQTLSRGDAAQAISASQAVADGALLIGPRDVLSVRVFQEPDLSFEEIQVDTDGRMAFPLIGTVNVSGMSTIAIGDMIAAKLRQGYLRDPQVTVSLVKSPSKRIVVEGSVKQPGVFEIPGTSSLIEAIAMAQGPTEQAKLSEVAVFREVNGERFGAIFDYQGIREGRVDDPRLLPGDRVVVGFDQGKGIYRDLLKAAPLFNIFTRF